jgi:hypothetical protein
MSWLMRGLQTLTTFIASVETTLLETASCILVLDKAEDRGGQVEANASWVRDKMVFTAAARVNFCSKL